MNVCSYANSTTQSNFTVKDLRKFEKLFSRKPIDPNPFRQLAIENGIQSNDLMLMVIPQKFLDKEPELVKWVNEKWIKVVNWVDEIYLITKYGKRFI